MKHLKGNRRINFDSVLNFLKMETLEVIKELKKEQTAAGFLRQPWNCENYV